VPAAGRLDDLYQSDVPVASRVDVGSYPQITQMDTDEMLELRPQISQICIDKDTGERCLQVTPTVAGGKHNLGHLRSFSQ